MASTILHSQGEAYTTSVAKMGGSDILFTGNIFSIRCGDQSSNWNLKWQGRKIDIIGSLTTWNADNNGNYPIPTHPQNFWPGPQDFRNRLG